MNKSSRLGGLLAAAVLSTALGPAKAQQAEEQARGGAVADGVSTAMGLAANVVNVHPLVPLVSIGLKAATFHYAETVPETDRPATYAFAAASWQGAAANNLCMTAAVLSGGSFLPACVVLGVAWGLKTWNDSEHERRFWERCAVLRQFTGDPNLPCVYKPPEKDPTSETPPAVALAVQELAWDQCGLVREFADQPNLPCVHVPAAKQTREPQRAVASAGELVAP
jgi:hypothetical protein